MSDATQRLMTLHVGDVMNKAPVQVSANQTMTEAADVLAEHGVSTAPVMDEQGRCVGILSATDFLQRECGAGHADEQSLTGETHRLVKPPGEQSFHINSVPESMVSCHMTLGVQSVSADATLLKAAHIMNTEHIHRLPVLDNDGRVIGMISTMDIVSSLLNAVDEESASFVRQMQSGDF